MPDFKAIVPRRPAPALLVLLAGAIALASTPGCSAGKDDGAATRKEKTMTDTLTVAAEAFDPGTAIPTEYTCEGENVSPAIHWEAGPGNVETWALIVDDPDAPGKTWVHWVVYNLPAGTHDLARAVAPDSTLPGDGAQGTSDFGKIGYGGPCPPPGHGPHHYHFKLYALDTRLDLEPGATKGELLNAMKGHVLAQSETVGIYERK